MHGGPPLVAIYDAVITERIKALRTRETSLEALRRVVTKVFIPMHEEAELALSLYVLEDKIPVHALASNAYRHHGGSLTHRRRYER